MRKTVLPLLLLLVLLGHAYADVSAPHSIEPPVQAKGLEAALYPIPQSTVAGYLAALGDAQVYDVFEGQNDVLKSLIPISAKQVEVATGFETDLGGGQLFTTVLPEGDRLAYLGSVTSADALALRLLMDFSGLAPEEEAWVLDPGGLRAFGPFTAQDAIDGGRWSPTVDGDTAVIMVSSPFEGTPDLTVIGLSHFFRGFDDPAFAKLAGVALPCNVNIACEGNTTVQSISSGVGLMVISDGQFDNALCSGTLINNPDTPENEPYFLTANHCVANQQEALSVEVIWDYRASACDTNDPPALATLPRSNGANLLATNAIVDMTLIELDAVTAGAFGRTYVGYTIRDIVLGEPVVGIHHPQGSHMRISYGTVRKLDVRSYAWENQLEVLWTQGVTEAGSSGSGLFLADGTYLLVGCLSNGPSHSCVDTSGNFDNFASLKVFYPSVQSYLSGTNPGAVGPVCPAKATFKSHPELLAHLRTFRDEGLRKLAWGNRLVDAYYKAAPVLARLVEQSPEARDAFMVASAPFATVGRMLTR